LRVRLRVSPAIRKLRPAKRIVSAGPIATPLYSKLGLPADQLKGVADSIQQQVPIKRFGTPTEFARTVLYFAFDDSAFTVGSELLIDGGMSNL
jgi:NAD(P)-dependent dehydrogenase (short-subunit alcohol dehydrogenase family)